MIGWPAANAWLLATVIVVSPTLAAAESVVVVTSTRVVVPAETLRT